ncbi:methyltransferase domain-containing protein [Sphingomonas sp. LY54]|uniref:class I SAM-dependent methyltransferase n=1 Tax=Sphingomonas sp. LY54 TaxID=3095343 RepID=UPI002D782793|nr:methyltransferase domain-containing protein [Sphingomonas sp. LY54]WRP28703.1 methyltransferase domain-containing protein [Sphingomonas sp. LY54]
MHNSPQRDDGDTFDPDTLAYYEKFAPTYSASGAGGQSRHLESFLALLAPSSRILDLGCGGGIDASAMLAQGFVVDAIEASPAIAAMAERRMNRPVKVMRFDELDAVEEYDAVWASASLIHVPRQGLSGILCRIFAALKPLGLHFASYKTGRSEGRDSVGRYYNYPSHEELLNFYRQSAPWQIANVTEYVGGGFEKGSGPWVAIITQRPR